MSRDDIVPSIQDGVFYQDLYYENLLEVARLPKYEKYSKGKPLSKRQWKALVQVCATNLHHVAGVRVGNKWYREEPLHDMNEEKPREMVRILVHGWKLSR